MILIMSNALIEKIGELASEEISFGAGQVVFTQGSNIRSIFLIAKGEVRLIRHQANGTAVVMQRATTGSVLAEASLFSDHYHCDAVAHTASALLPINKTVLIRKMATDFELTKSWNIHLAHEIQNARRSAEIVSLRTVAAKLDAWIVWNDGVLPAKGEWKAIAEQIATSPEALYRELAKRRAVRKG